MKTILLLAVTAALMIGSAGRAMARLGETEAQVEARFGPAVSGDKEPRDGMLTKLYTKSGVQVMVFFIAGKSAAEGYSKDNLEAFSETEVQTLLEANAQGKNTWEESKQTNFTKKIFLRSDAQAKAIDTRIGKNPNVLIASKAWFDSANKTRQEKEKKNLAGF